MKMNMLIISLLAGFAGTSKASESKAALYLNTPEEALGIRLVNAMKEALQLQNIEEMKSLVAKGAPGQIALLLPVPLKKGSEIIDRLWTFSWAVAQGNLELVEFLYCDDGTSINERSFDCNKTPLYYAIEYGYPEIEEYLREQGAKEE